MGFGNPVIGGASKLIRDAIQSTLYTPSVTGWTVNKDGTVEFTAGTFRGTIVIGAAGEALLIYRGTPAAGSLLFAASALAVNEFDAFGNVVPPGVTVFDPGSGFATLKFNGDGFGQLIFDPATNIFTLNNGVGPINIAADSAQLDAASLLLNLTGAGFQLGAGLIGKSYHEHVTFPNKTVASGGGYNTWGGFTQREIESDYGAGQWSLVGGQATWTCPVTALYAFSFYNLYTAFVAGSRIRMQLQYTGARAYGPYSVGEIGKLDVNSAAAVDGGEFLGVPVIGLDAGNQITPRFAQVTGAGQTTDTNSYCAVRRLL